jgi:iron complex transport system substrate-binding protein
MQGAEILRTLPGIEKLSAVRAGRVVAVDGNAYFNRSGPRIVDSLEILARVLHPELFGTPSSGEAQSVQLN